MNGIEENFFQGLEYQVDNLLKNIQQLRHENSALKNQLLQLKHRFDQLDLEKKLTVNKIKKIIVELKRKTK